MPIEPSTICDCCGRAMLKAQAIHDGRAYCQTCYAREFKPVQCAGCGKGTRSLLGEEPAYCKSCRIKDRKCGGCGKELPHASRIDEDGTAYCWPCSRKKNIPKTCPMCGEAARSLSKFEAEGINVPVCDRCRNRKTHFTCPSCHKYRKPAGVNRKTQRIVCKSCLSDDAFVCPKCKQQGTRHSAAQCTDCYWADHAHSAISKGVAVLKRRWTQVAYQQLGQALIDIHGSQQASHRLPLYLAFFIALDARYSDHAKISVRDLVLEYGKEGLRRNSTAVNFLIKAGFLPAAAEWELDHYNEVQRQEKLIERCTGKWYHSLLVRFREHALKIQQISLDRNNKGPNSATIYTWLLSAELLLEFLSKQGIDNIGGLNSDQASDFVLSNPGYRRTIPRFFKYILKHERDKLFKLFALPKEKDVATPPNRLFLTDQKATELTLRFLDPMTPAKEAALGLLMLYCAQSSTRVVRLRMSQLSIEDGRLAIKFARMPIALDPDIETVLRRYLAEREPKNTMESAEENPFLFPGRRLGNHMAAASVFAYLKSWSVSSEAMVATCVFRMFQGGIRHPNIPHHAYGVSKAACGKYLQMYDPRLSDAINEQLGRQMAKERRNEEAHAVQPA